MPGVKRENFFQRPRSGLRMNELAAEVIIRQRVQKRTPSRMYAFDDLQRNIDGHTAVGQLRPAIFVIGPDRRRLVFCQCQFEPAERIDVAIRDVMHGLSKRPTTFAVRSVELLVRQSLDRLSQLHRKIGDRLLIFLARRVSCSIEFSDWKSRVNTHFSLSFLDGVSSDFTTAET